MADNAIVVESKNWYASKTLWCNVIVLVLAIVALFADQPWMPPKYVALATGVVVPVLNMVLRVLTGQPLATSSNPAPK